MILVDSCVLIDVIEGDADWAGWSASQLEELQAMGQLVANIVIYAEIAKSFASLERLDEFVEDSGIAIEPIPRKAAYQAAQTHLAYRRNRGTMVVTLPDFFIGAHAAAAGYSILTRDRKRFSTYFPTVRLITPEAP